MLLRRILRAIGHQDWIRFGLRDRLIRAYHHPDTSASERFEVAFYGMRYDGDFSTFIDWSTYYYGAYAKEELEFMREALEGTASPVILDVGANIGHHTLFAATIAERVHSFEPFPAVFAKIHEKIRANRLANVTVHEVGLGEKDEDLTYFPPRDANTGTGSFVGQESTVGSFKLPIRQGDHYISDLDLTKVDFVKIDIEGFEPQALRGLTDILQKYRPIVFFEWSAEARQLGVTPFELFPENYSTFQFLSAQPHHFLFNSRHYKLVPSPNSVVDGNLVAMPNEFLKAAPKTLLSRIG